MTPISMFEIQVLNSNPGLRIYALSFETYLNSDKPQNRERERERKKERERDGQAM